jgi:hypothetical protein
MPMAMMLSREVRRVPLDFDAPVGETWEPLLYDGPSFPSCPDCGPATIGGYGTDADGNPQGDGMTPGARQIERTWYAHDVRTTPYFAQSAETRKVKETYQWCDKLTQDEVDHLVAEGRLMTWVPPAEGEERGHYEALPRDAAQVNANSLHEHDAINRWIAVRYRCEKLGIEMECPTCKGHGDVATDEERAAADAWTPPKPPEGEGWQLWQTVSEGGPVSPVFETAEALAEWLVTGEKVAGQTFTRDEWMRVIVGDAALMDIHSGSML